MKISNVHIEDHYQHAVLLADCYQNNIKHEIFYAVERKNKQYFDDLSADAFVLATLVKAMEFGEDLLVDYPISAKLKYHLETYLIPWLARVNSYLKKIKIIPLAGYTKHIYENTAIATGISCGVDSFYTVLNHLTDSIPQTLRLTHAVLNHHQSEKTFKQAQPHLSIGKKDQERLDVGAELGVATIYVWTNVNQFIDFPYEQIVTFHDLSVGLSLQRLIRTYHYASSYPLTDFCLTFDAAPYYDILNSLAIQTDNFQMLSHAVLEERVEKTKFVAKYPIVQRHLDVCFHEAHSGKRKNCSCCEKCVRTMVTLDALGQLDNFAEVFDIELYRKQRKRRIGSVLYRACVNKNSYDVHIKELLRIEKQKIPLSCYGWLVNTGLHNQLAKVKGVISRKRVLHTRTLVEK